MIKGPFETDEGRACVRRAVCFERRRCARGSFWGDDERGGAAWVRRVFNLAVFLDGGGFALGICFTLPMLTDGDKSLAFRGGVGIKSQVERRLQRTMTVRRRALDTASPPSHTEHTNEMN